MRALTPRQVLMLEAIERRGSIGNWELREEFPAMKQSELWRIVASLQMRGLVSCVGDPWERYTGGLRVHALPPDPEVRAL